ncbi:MAG: 10.2 kDa unknown protein [Plant associated caulimovirus 1]|nr:MAG: 10.2 kDa unknown protein [Plant associated caulimovirus 1]
MTDQVIRANKTPLWEAVANIQEQQIAILDRILKLEEKLKKIDITRLETTLVNLEAKIPEIEPLFREIKHVIKITHGIGGELGIKVETLK